MTMPASMLLELHKIAAEAGNSQDFRALDLLHDVRAKKKKRILPPHKESQLPRDPKKDDPEDTNLEDARDSTEQTALADAQSKTASLGAWRLRTLVMRALGVGRKPAESWKPLSSLEPPLTQSQIDAAAKRLRGYLYRNETAIPRPLKK